jgi:site-specific DNA recombinase
LQYYISNRLVSGGTDPSGWRIPASVFETAVKKVIAEQIQRHATHHSLLQAICATEAAAASTAAAKLVKKLQSSDGPLLRELITSGQITKDRILIQLKTEVVALQIGYPVDALNHHLCDIDAPLSLRRRGHEVKIIAGEPVPEPDQTLIRALRNANKWAGALRSGMPLKTIARTDGFSDNYVARIIPLAGLSSKIQTDILDGIQPTQLSLETLIRVKLPMEWHIQERVFGFA